MPWELIDTKPIYIQLMDRIERMIISGKYKPGDKLPTVRDLSKEASVNPNTMQKAFVELERTGIIYTNRTSGRYVTEDNKLINECRDQIADTIIREFVQKMEELGYEREEIVRVIQKEGEKNANS